MALLVEARSLIVRLDEITEECVGGLEAFIAGIHSATVCMDGELVRVGFLSLAEADAARGPRDGHARESAGSG